MGNREKSSVELNVPWDIGHQLPNMCVQSLDGSDEVTKEFIRERSRVHEAYIREQEKSKRLSLIIAAFLFVSALFVVVFAPDGREELSYWFGATLLVFASGAAGYKRLWAKAPLFNVEVSNKT